MTTANASIIALDDDRDEITTELVAWCNEHDPRELPNYCHVWPMTETGDDQTEMNLIGVAKGDSVLCGRLLDHIDSELAVSQIRRKLRQACRVTSAGYVDTDAGQFRFCAAK